MLNSASVSLYIDNRIIIIDTQGPDHLNFEIRYQNDILVQNVCSLYLHIAKMTAFKVFFLITSSVVFLTKMTEPLN